MRRDHRGLRGDRSKVHEHIANYGVGIEQRLTGAHETAHYLEFCYGASDRGASIRIPWGTVKDGRAGSRTVVRTPTWTPTS